PSEKGALQPTCAEALPAVAETLRGEPGKVGVGTMTWPIAPVPYSVNQTLSSGPVVIPIGPLDAVGTEFSTIAPVGEIWPIALPLASVNQTFPSGPRARPVSDIAFGVFSAE